MPESSKDLIRSAVSHTVPLPRSPARPVSTGSKRSTHTSWLLGNRGDHEPFCLACITTLEFGLFVFSLVVNKGFEPLSANPMLGPSAMTLYLCGGLNMQDDQYWRLLSCIFLHAGVAHVMPNLVVQWLIGCILESRVGSLKIAAVYVVGGLGGSLLSMTLSKPDQLSVGASGAVHSLAAVLVVLDPGRPTSLANFAGAGDRLHWMWYLTAFGLLASLLSGIVMPAVDSWAHLGGTYAGFTMSALFFPSRGYCAFVIRLFILVTAGGFVGVCVYLHLCSGCFQPPGQIAGIFW